MLELEKLMLKNKKKNGGKDTGNFISKCFSFKNHSCFTGKEGSKASSRKTSRSNSASSNNTSRKMSTDSSRIH